MPNTEGFKVAPAFLNLHTAVMIILILGRNRLFFFHGEQVSLLLLRHDCDPTCTCFIPGLLRPAFSLKIAVWCASLESLSYIYTILCIRASKYIPPPSAKLPFYPYEMALGRHAGPSSKFWSSPH